MLYNKTYSSSSCIIRERERERERERDIYTQTKCIHKQNVYTNKNDKISERYIFTVIRIIPYGMVGHGVGWGRAGQGRVGSGPKTISGPIFVSENLIDRIFQRFKKKCEIFFLRNIFIGSGMVIRWCLVSQDVEKRLS